MKILRLEHVGIAVDSLFKSNDLFAKVLNKLPYKEEEVESEAVNTSFFRAGETKIELLESTAENSAISRFIGKRGEGIHHLAFEVEDIQSAWTYCMEHDLQPLGKGPTQGADNKLIFFVHPRKTGGVLIEFCQSIK